MNSSPSQDPASQDPAPQNSAPQDQGAVFVQPKPQIILGIAMMLGFCFFVALLDGMAKQLMHSGLPVSMTLWGRYTAQFILYTVLLAVFFRPRLKAALRPNKPRLQIVRSLVLVVETGCVFLALSYLPLAETIAVTFIYPLLVVLLAVPFLGEKLGPLRLGGVLIGFAGALLMLRPGGVLFHPAVFAALASAVLFATYQLMTRSLSEADTPWTTLFYTAGGGAVASLFLALVYWQTPSLADITTFAILGALGILAHTCLVLAFTWATCRTGSEFRLYRIDLRNFLRLVVLLAPARLHQHRRNDNHCLQWRLRSMA